MKTKLGLSALLALQLNTHPVLSAENATDEYFADLERFWSYDRSPPVYPTPQSSGTDNWAAAYKRASALVAQMTLDERANLTYGYAGVNGCSGNTGSVPRLNISGFCVTDAGHGVRGQEGVNAYPASLHVGASWNRALAHTRAQHMGAEFKRKGVNVMLGPSVGALGRVPRGGRNWEGASNDPYLAGALIHEAISGIQESVVACVKHFIGNEQETSRKIADLVGDGHNQSISVNMDDATMHEVYLWPFYDAIQAGAGAVMCSYNRVNNSYACQNSKLLNGLLKTELGFQGPVMTDWGEHKSGVGSANAGLDLVMPSAPLWNGDKGDLVEMVNNGSVSESRLSDMATRVLAAMFRFADFAPGTGMPSDLTAAHTYTEARVPESKAVLRQSAIEGHVLVKNVDGALPLTKPRFMSVFGYDAAAQRLNTPEKGTFPMWQLGMGGAEHFLNGSAFTQEAYFAAFLASNPVGQTGPAIALNGTLYTGGGSGAAPGMVDAPLDALKRRAYDDDTFLFWDVESPLPRVNPASEACLVFINALATEGYDRPSLADEYSDNLVLNVAGQCNNTMVIVHAAGIRLVDAWIEHPNITAVIMAHLPGQDSGRALVDLLYGAQSPSGRLPYTLAKTEADYGSHVVPTRPDAATPWYPQSNFSEGQFIDYKHFAKHNIAPRFEFGFGLTYTKFDYSNLTVSKSDAVSLAVVSEDTTVASGGLRALWDVVATVSCTVKNVGDVAAAEVAQLYVGRPGEDQPEKVLRGFEKKLLKPGQSETFVFPLRRRDLSVWSVERQQWVLQAGEHKIFVGKSILDIPLEGVLSF